MVAFGLLTAIRWGFTEMGRNHIFLLLIIVTLLISSACFRESTVEQAPTTTTQTTQENLASLATGTDAMGQTGDFVLESSTVQAVVNGPTEDTDRAFFLGKNAGSVWDLSTRFESTINRQLFSRNDDGIQQLTQGVNLNRNTLVSYDRIRVNPVDRNIATLVMQGRIFDLDGSLEASGAAVDSSTRALLNCEVETILEVRNDIDNPNNSELDFLVFYLGMTTVIRNTGDTPLPIFTVNDIMVTQHNAYELFVPYPEWGFDRPTTPNDNTAYPPFIQFQPRQVNTAHYGFTSRLDGVVMTREEKYPSDQVDITYVGKANTSNSTLAAGEQMTFVRECFALNGLNSGVENFLSIESAYGALVDFLSLTPTANSPYSQTGQLTLSLVTNRDQDGRIVVEMFNQGMTYFNGTGFVPLEEGRFLPLFGSTPVFNSYTNIRLPAGQARVVSDLANGDPVVITKNVIRSVDSDGNEQTTEEDILIAENESLIMFGVEVSALRHAPVGVRMLNEQGRILFGHIILSEADGSEDVTIGELPDSTQGRVFYVDSINSNSIFLPDGDYILSASHGPRFGLNSPTTAISERVVEGSDPERRVFGALPASFTYTLSEQVPLPGYLSADFDVRTDNDASGLVSMRSLIRYAYSEDLDVLFAADSRNPSEMEAELRTFALGLGSLDLEDLGAQVNSFFDEVAVSRAIATYGRRKQAPQKLGRFAIFNLPKADAQQDFVLPGFEGDPAGFYDRVRQRHANAIIQVSRPRSPEGLEAGLFTAMAAIEGLPAGTPLPGDANIYQETANSGSNTRWIDFDLLQVLSGNNYEEYLLSRQDWFGLLNQGIFKPATGGTLPGETKDLPLGTVRTYVKLDDTTLRDSDLQSFWQAAKDGHSFITNGPIIEASINGASFGDTTSASGSVALTLKVSAADWIPVDEVRIIVNGVVQDVQVQLNQDAVVRFDGQVTLDLPSGQNNWVVIEAGSSLDSLVLPTSPGRQYWRAYPGHKPVAFTNPIFVQ